MASSDHIFIFYSNTSSDAKLTLCEILLLIERVGSNNAYADITARLIKEFYHFSEFNKQILTKVLVSGKLFSALTAIAPRVAEMDIYEPATSPISVILDE